ncbi:ABC transporter permease subunit [Serpentinicella sp. ANB-PHB4]|uniref:ABC transporter permease n=1 Tax=Serpentinicella sp. ANB-PHB4 TaxID=3074076 RepID=UPI00285E9F3F|nr:ABC transporter permease [Serpentinicella sp. ANB-PHB4]MDR5659077.1 ABC transporter permease subunit [Serpentinicella sp. ANB-PHB4]
MIGLSNTLIIWKKEMIALFRDKKALLTIFLPILIYPLLIIIFMGFVNIVQSNLNQKVSTVAVKQYIADELLHKLEEDEKIQLIELQGAELVKEFEDQHDAQIKGSIDEGIEKYTLYFNRTIDTSQRAAMRVQRHIIEYEEEIREKNLDKIGMSDQINNIVQIEHIELTDDGESRSIYMILGMLIPFIIVIYGISGTYTIASDLSAGEKERNTLETIFSIPIKRFHIIIGKLLACVTVGIISGMVNILAIFPIVYGITVNIPEFQVSISLSLFLFLLIVLVVLMVLTSTFFIGLGLLAKTYQESQNYGSVLLILFMALSYIAILPAIEISTVTLMIPITNGILIMREAFLGNYTVLNTLYVLSINLGLAGIGVFIMNYLFKSDRVIFGGEKG